MSKTTTPITRVLFLCTGNACRSQMAQGWLRELAGDRFDVYSAGTDPHGVNPLAVEAMSHAGVDISHQSSDSVGLYLDQPFDWVITLCGGANESCPVFTGTVAHREHWPFDDPGIVTGDQERIMAAFSRVRDQIRQRLEHFIRVC